MRFMHSMSQYIATNAHIAIAHTKAKASIWLKWNVILMCAIDIGLVQRSIGDRHMQKYKISTLTQSQKCYYVVWIVITGNVYMRRLRTFTIFIHKLCTHTRCQSSSSWCRSFVSSSSNREWTTQSTVHRSLARALTTNEKNGEINFLCSFIVPWNGLQFVVTVECGVCRAVHSKWLTDSGKQWTYSRALLCMCVSWNEEGDSSASRDAHKCEFAIV